MNQDEWKKMRTRLPNAIRYADEFDFRSAVKHLYKSLGCKDHKKRDSIVLEHAKVVLNVESEAPEEKKTKRQLEDLLIAEFEESEISAAYHERKRQRKEKEAAILEKRKLLEEEDLASNGMTAQVVNP